MTKALKISMFAILAVTPMVVHAAKTATTVDLVNNGNTPAQTETVATTSYVQGAYNMLGTQINAIINDSNVPAPAEGTTYNAISQSKNVAENLQALDNKIGQAADTNSATYVRLDSAVPSTAGTEAEEIHLISDANNTVGVNLGILDDQVYKNTVKIGAFGSNATLNNISENASIHANLQSLDTQVEANANKIGTYDGTKSHVYVTDTDVFSNLQELDYQTAGNASATSLNQAAIGAIAELAAAGGMIPAGTTNLVSAIKAINTSLSDVTGGNTIQDGTYTSAGDTVGNAIKALDTAVTANADKIGNTAMGTQNTTVTGAIAEMHGQTMELATVWGQENTSEGTTTVYLFQQH